MDVLDTTLSVLAPAPAPAPLPMTDEIMALRGLMEKCADTDLLHERIGFAIERLIELEVGGPTGATHGEMSAERLVRHDRDRDW